MLLLAIKNGGVREAALILALGKTMGLVARGLVLPVLIFVFAYLGVVWFRPLTPDHYWVIGTCWLPATLIFEFTFSRMVAGKMGCELLAAYTFELWPLVLAVIASSPWVCARSRAFA